ncbi:hypothetical protein FHR83_004279 [Actinoplanes campanulatus]|uniref:DUF4037 domain-containing protein n=1 Tax=Actinoplanes campanulatus TaxID=113559 RepID=A0A7W5AIB0_9ACTN|nr:DUF4037 domain-containing protein [Actinoplanes campanulatus]MBB3096605.1 hypothetical protein [Actinoplanes campanulatus]GGN30134.1 hypothetical protein GCM10010109_49570 [Actinoplanes campanulatus]GID37144.1 hypothetical protein Aca09nite_36500 [Actinoplanes campanulatus]
MIDDQIRLRGLGERFAAGFPDLSGVRAVLLTGSVARGLADRWSDVELMVFWDGEPADESRRAAVAAAGGELTAFHGYDPDNDEWSEDVLFDGVEVQVSHRTVAGAEGWVADVTQRFDPDLTKQDLIALIRYGVALHDSGVVAGWRSRTEVYPDALGLAMVRAHLEFRSAWQRRKLLARGDVLPLAQDRLDTVRNVLLVLLGLNRVWFPHLGFKWVRDLAEGLPLAPAALPARLEAVLTATPASAVPAADALIMETLELVAKHLPTAGAEEEITHQLTPRPGPG